MFFFVGDAETRRRTADARGGDAAGRAERSARVSRDTRRGGRVSRKSASRVARVSTVAPRRGRRPTTPTTDARNVEGRAGGLLFSRRRGISGTRPRSAIETAPAGKCARARAYLVLRAINHRRFRGHAVAHLAQVRPLMAPREFIFVVNLAIARFTEVGVVVVAVDGGVGVVAQHTRHHLGRLLDLAMIQIRPDPESTRRLALAPRDPTRREDFFLGASRERHRRCFLRSAMDRPRKRARLPTPTRPSSSFAPRRVSRLTPRVPKRASPSPAPRAPAHAAPSGVDVVTRIKRVSQAYPEWCRTPKTCCQVTRGRGSRTSNLTNRTAS